MCSMHSIVTTFRGAVIKVEVASFCAAIDTLIDQDGSCAASIIPSVSFFNFPPLSHPQVSSDASILVMNCPCSAFFLHSSSFFFFC